MNNGRWKSLHGPSSPLTLRTRLMNPLCKIQEESSATLIRGLPDASVARWSSRKAPTVARRRHTRETNKKRACAKEALFCFPCQIALQLQHNRSKKY